MEYISSRGQGKAVVGSKAILEGLAADGGLYVPKALPSLGNLKDILTLNYRQLAVKILCKFFPNLPREKLEEAVEKAYKESFEEEEIIKIKKSLGVSFLELYHGPTLAFKDMALALLPYLIRIAKDVEGLDKEILILTATSGDTGKAALNAFADETDTKIVVYYPEDGVSQVQKLQMKTQEGDNTLVVGVRGNFDHAQTGVKSISNDKFFNEFLKDKDYQMSSANSINVARLVPQTIYYIYAYMEMVRQGEIELGELINISVPTGNFGNILAAFYAKEMGLPLGKLICASNDNNVLTEFFQEKNYNIRQELICTSSPSMDILISSNLERLLYYLSDGDQIQVREKMLALERDGKYEMAGINLSDFYGGFADERMVSQSIRELYQEGNYLVDPHTAVAYGVYKEYKEEWSDDKKTLIVSTASPFKFAGKVASSIGLNIEGMEEFAILESLAHNTGLQLPANIDLLRGKPIRHNKVVDRQNMMEEILNFL